MKRIVGIIAIALAACAPAQPRRIAAPLPESPAGVPRDVLAREVDEDLALAERACGCKDAACFDAVDAALIAKAKTEHRKSYVTEIEPFPPDLAALEGYAWRRIEACERDIGYSTSVWMTTDVMDATDIRNAACSCTDIGCARHLAEVLAHYREIQIKLAPPGTPERRAWDLANLEADECINQRMAQQAMVELVQMRDDACECEDRVCIDRVMDAMKQWGTDYRSIRATADVTEQKVSDITAEIVRCAKGFYNP